MGRSFQEIGGCELAGTDYRIPEFRWSLPAAESMVLLWGPDTGDPWVLKVALLELVVRRCFAVSTTEKRRFLRSPKPVHMFTKVGAVDPSPSPPLLAIDSAYHLLAQTPGVQGGVPLRLLASTILNQRRQKMRTGLFKRRNNQGTAGFVRSQVLPELQRQGLFRVGADPHVPSLDLTRWWLTTEGLARLNELVRLNDIGRNALPGWVNTNPALAREYVERAGSSLLLLGGIPSILRGMRDRNESATRGARNNPFSVESLSGTFGSYPPYDLDHVFFLISGEVDRAWQDLSRDGGSE